MDFPEIQTERLILRTLTLADKQMAFAHFSDPEVMRFTDTEPCACLKDAEDIVIFHAKDSGCRYGLFRKSDSQLIGTCGYHCCRNEPEPIAEIGYDLSVACWGQGYMREASLPVMCFGVQSMALAKIEAPVAVANKNSVRFLMKLNFRREETVRKGEYLFYLPREDWESRFRT